MRYQQILMAFTLFQIIKHNIRFEFFKQCVHSYPIEKIRRKSIGVYIDVVNINDIQPEGDVRNGFVLLINLKWDRKKLSVSQVGKISIPLQGAYRIKRINIFRADKYIFSRAFSEITSGLPIEQFRSIGFD